MTEVEPEVARVLIVDDETAHMHALCETLRDQGYETAGFSKGSAALAALRSERYDLLLTDLMMPEMDGIALLKEALQADPNLVGVIMTGEGTIASAVDAMKAGALDYILKPFKLSAALPVIARGLAVRRLRLQNVALERSVRERTAELEAANKELEAFSYSVSHDLRAPLRAIAGFTQILLEDHASELAPDARHLVDNVLRNAGRMHDLIEGLLRLSRVSRQHVSQEQVDLAALVHDVLDELRKSHLHGRAQVHVGDMPACRGDRDLLRQVLVNLLSNAFKFTREKAAAVVAVGCLEQSHERAYYVKDNGAGFDMQHADKLFGVFQRLHPTEQFEGTGVGLSIVRRVVERHGGRVWAEAAPGEGATFYFTIPTPLPSSLRGTP